MYFFLNYVIKYEDSKVLEIVEDCKEILEYKMGFFNSKEFKYLGDIN